MHTVDVESNQSCRTEVCPFSRNSVFILVSSSGSVPPDSQNNNLLLSTNNSWTDPYFCESGC